MAGNTSEERRAAAQSLLAMASETVRLDAAITRRAEQLQSAGYSAYDALHLATAEAGDCQVLLSMGDDLSRAPRAEPVTQDSSAKSGIMDKRRRVLTAFEKMTDEQFERHAFDVLRRELGSAGLARFLRLPRSGPGDYTHDRDAWQEAVTVEQEAANIRRRDK